MLHSATTEKRITVEYHVGPGQRTKRGTASIMSKMGLSEVVEVISMAIDVPRPTHKFEMVGMQSSSLYQHPWPLASLVSASVASMVYQFPLTSASSFFFCSSVCTFSSSSTSLSWRGDFSEDGPEAKRGR